MVAKKTARCERAGWGEYCPLSEPIRLQELQNTARSRTEKKITRSYCSRTKVLLPSDQGRTALGLGSRSNSLHITYLPVQQNLHVFRQLAWTYLLERQYLVHPRQRRSLSTQPENKKKVIIPVSQRQNESEINC